MDVLEVVRLSLRYVHLLGMALLLGGSAVQLFARQYRINSAMLYGIGIQLITGIALSAPLGRDDQPDPAKLAIKFVLAVILAVMIVIPRSRPAINKGHFYGIVGVALVTVAVATFWT